MSIRARLSSRREFARRGRGQALVETALIAPALVMLLLGGAQVGSIAYNQVSLDSAAREGARAGAAAPSTAVFSDATNTQWYAASDPTTYSYNCQNADFIGTNPICTGVLKSTGFLSASTFESSPCPVRPTAGSSNQACVTIKVVPPTSLAAARVGPPGLRLVAASQPAPNAAASPCNQGNYAEVDGSVSGASGTITLSDSVPSDPKLMLSSPYTFQYCVSANNTVSTQTIVAQEGPVGCGGSTGSISVRVTHGQQISGQTISLTTEGTCTTSTSTSTSTTTTSTTSSTTSTTSTATGSSSSVTGPPIGCAAPAVSDTYYFQVTITYPAPIFIPFLNQLFQTSSGVRMLTTSVTYPIDPCSMAQ